eukprot:391364_1
MSKTWIADQDLNVYVGNYHPASNGTAHLRLCKSYGVNPRYAYGGSIKANGYVGFASSSINLQNYGVRDIGNTQQARRIENKIVRGDYYVQRNTGHGYRVAQNDYHSSSSDCCVIL